ncbi:MAG: ECF-type sigma factor [Lysobacterales bacterium]
MNEAQLGQPLATDITAWLQQWQDGDQRALDRLLPWVYDELRRLAASQLRAHAGHATLQPTALVHDVFVRLLGAERLQISSTRHLYTTASRVMRQILIDRARAQQRDKRGGQMQRVELIEAVGLPIEADTDLLDLDRSLSRLNELDARLAQIVELRFFVGLEVSEVAALLELDERTVYRDWALARAWLQRHCGSADNAL